MTFGNERNISFRLVTERRNANFETIRTTQEGMLRLGMNTNFRDVQEFKRNFSTAYSKAMKMLKAGEAWDEFSISVADYAWDEKPSDYLDYHSEGFLHWSLDPYGQETEQGFLYALPDTKYTPESWDMLVYSDIFKTLAEAGV